MATPNHSWSYWAYGYNIESAIPIPLFLPRSHSQDSIVHANDSITIKVQSPGQVSHHIPNAVAQQSIAVQASEQKITLYVKATAVFVIEGGCQITCYPVPNLLDSQLSLALSGIVMAALLFQRQCFIAHGSAVSLNQNGVVFLGDSGAGKSSLAIALHQQGYPMITDDLVAITYQNGVPYLLPAFPQTRVTQETAEALSLNWSSLKQLPNTPKRGFRFADAFVMSPIPLRRIYILKSTEHDMQIHDLQAHQQLMELMHHSEVMSLFSQEKTDHFLSCAQLAQHVSIQSLERPHRWSQLPKILDYFQHHWSA